MAEKDSKSSAKTTTATSKPKATAKTTASTAKSKAENKTTAAAKPSTSTGSAVDNKAKASNKTVETTPKADNKVSEKPKSAKATATPSDEKAKTETKTTAKQKSDTTRAKADESAKKAVAPKKETKKAQDSKSAATIITDDSKKSERSDSAPKKQDTAKKPEDEKNDALTKEKKPSANKKQSSAKGGANNKNKPLSKKKLLSIIIPTVSIVLMIAIIVGIVIGARSCDKGGENNNNGGNGNNNGNGGNGGTSVFVPYETVGAGIEHAFAPEQIKDFVYDTDIVSNTIVGYSGKQIGTVDRIIPQTPRNEGRVDNDKYPKFGYTPQGVLGTEDAQVAIRNALIAESSYLTATGTSNAGGGDYKWMDENGFLYKGTVADPVPSLDSFNEHRRLYKHTCADGLYYGNVSPDEPGIIKQVTMRPRGYSGYGVTGVYAPAGEVIKIQISEEDMNATGGIVIHIGQALYNGQANNIWTAKNQMQRIPHLLNTMVVTKDTATLKDGVYTAYVGSFIGGPLYIRNTNATFTATISGGVAYSHFILGYTTKEEFEQNRQSSAPYFDLEVWHYGVLHSGPKYFAQNFSYEDIYKAAVLWDKVASVTTTGSSQGIVFLYDAFVAAGAAVAFPGRRSVNCPAGWMSGSLNYNALVSSGSWGNFHEYHHNFQGYGVGNGGEVTNNGMTLVSYALFTNISAKRGLESYGAQGLGGWNSYTSATWALNEVLKIAKGQDPSNGKQGLTLYSTLLHNFGADNYIQAKVQQQSHGYGQSYVGYLKAWQDITHNDMSYYFKDILQGITEQEADELTADIDYPMFVPVSSVYQTGRSYMYDGQKKYFNTMRPFVIPYGEDYTIDLRPYTVVKDSTMYDFGSIVLPDGFTYTIKNITQPENGTITPLGNGLYRYSPNKNSNSAFSGEILVTLGITKDDGAFTVDDVDLVLQFEQSHETNKMTLTRTTYTFDASNLYTDAVTAYENGFANYIGKTTIDHSNPVQNCNTDIWYYVDTPENRAKYPDAPDHFFLPANSVVELSGKLYFENKGKYRIYLRGRANCAFYYSLDKGKTYTLGGKVTNGSGAGFYTGDPQTYVDIELEEHSWVYFKEILIAQQLNGSQTSYIGLGYGAWTEPMFTMVEKYYDANGKELSSANDEGYDHTVIKYYNYLGQEVTEEEANRADLIPPTKASYVNAYRDTYEFPSNAGFETDYFYVRQYSYTYSEKTNANKTEMPDISIVSNTVCAAQYPITNLIDGDPNTFCSSNAIVSADAPWEVIVDLGKTIEANRFELTGNLFNGSGAKNQTPNCFTLYVGETRDDLHEVLSIENGQVSGISTAANFETSRFRYYRLVVTKTVEGRFMCIRNIAFSKSLSGGKNIAPDDEMFTYSDDWKGMQTMSTFGHVYVGKANDTLTFKFNGTRVGFISSAKFGKNFEVYIDNAKVGSMELKTADGDYAISYLCDKLAAGEHTVTLKCLGDASVDSVLIFNEA